MTLTNGVFPPGAADAAAALNIADTSQMPRTDEGFLKYVYDYMCCIWVDPLGFQL